METLQKAPVNQTSAPSDSATSGAPGRTTCVKQKRRVRIIAAFDSAHFALFKERVAYYTKAFGVQNHCQTSRTYKEITEITKEHR
ncbi:hypothetical protein L596_008689 [Steinernema carpocapsae]|uniref:Uncharacterized protein n=1 Tax=Steinernema carpocapsae TaxID=34508 RepID=A0A4U5PED0_STECR|nr:hypothetical protein L596_008689 [Steinernema carpocapsae]